MPSRGTSSSAMRSRSSATSPSGSARRISPCGCTISVPAGEEPDHRAAFQLGREPARPGRRAPAPTRRAPSGRARASSAGRRWPRRRGHRAAAAAATATRPGPAHRLAAGTLHDALDAPHEVGHLVAEQRHLLQRRTFERVPQRSPAARRRPPAAELSSTGVFWKTVQPGRPTSREGRSGPRCRTCRRPAGRAPARRCRTGRWKGTRNQSLPNTSENSTSARRARSVEPGLHAAEVDVGVLERPEPVARHAGVPHRGRHHRSA